MMGAPTAAARPVAAVRFGSLQTVVLIQDADMVTLFIVNENGDAYGTR